MLKSEGGNIQWTWDRCGTDFCEFSVVLFVDRQVQHVCIQTVTLTEVYIPLPCKMFLLWDVVEDFWDRPRPAGFGSEAVAPEQPEK